MSAFRQLDADIMVQEFIKESSGTDIRAFVVGNRVVAAMERTAPNGDFPLNTNGGGLSYCHPGMYGIFTIIESGNNFFLFSFKLFFV